MLFRFRSPYTQSRFSSKSTDVSESFTSLIVEKIMWKYECSEQHNGCPLCKASASLTCTKDAQEMINKVRCMISHCTKRLENVLLFFSLGFHWEVSSAVRMKIVFKLFSLIYFYHLKSKMSNVLTVFCSWDGKFIFQIKKTPKLSTLAQKSISIYTDKKLGFLNKLC